MTSTSRNYESVRVCSSVARRAATRALGITGLFVVVASLPGAAFAGTKINIEGVTEYRNPSCAGDTTAVYEMDQFRNLMLYQNPAGYAAGQRLPNDLVWASDFTEDAWGGDDDLYFDKYGTAISYVAGHGGEPAGAGIVNACTTGSNCYSFSMPFCNPSYSRFCSKNIGSALGECACTSFDRRIVTNDCASANYSSGAVKWGESAYSGAWAGVGVNGGTNVVVLSISFPHRVNRGHELYPAFAGVHLILSPLNHSGDTSDHPDRGFWLAFQYYLDPSKTVLQSWLDGGAAMSFDDGECCGVGTPYAGCGFGIGGCGGHIGLTMDSASSLTAGHLNEDWWGVQQDWRDAKGNAYWQNIYACNWDCAATGFAQ